MEPISRVVAKSAARGTSRRKALSYISFLLITSILYSEERPEEQASAIPLLQVYHTMQGIILITGWD